MNNWNRFRAYSRFCYNYCELGYKTCCVNMPTGIYTACN